MLDKKTFNQLKQYRGWVLARLTDLQLDHDATQTHVIGSRPWRCAGCQRYLALKEEHLRLSELVARVRGRRQTLAADRDAALEHHYYLYSEIAGRCYVVLAEDERDATIQLEAYLAMNIVQRPKRLHQAQYAEQLHAAVADGDLVLVGFGF